MQKIIPFLWFEKDVPEVTRFYNSVFRDSKTKEITTMVDTPSGTVQVANVELLGLEFTFLAAGPLFKFTPAVSFLVACKTKEEVVSIWEQLSEGGSALMELGEYPFSEKYGWIQDRYGLSWQIMFMGNREIKQNMIPILMFVGKQAGKAEEAIRFYVSVFRNAKVGDTLRYGKGEEPDPGRNNQVRIISS